MDNYMIAIINGSKDDDGEISYLGHNFNFNYHAQCLLDYASKKYPEIYGFSNLDYMDEPNSPIYYLSLLGNIIFTNISVDGEKRGVLYFPKKITDKQVDKLYKFIDSISDYNVWIVYDMAMVDGMFIGETFDFDEEFVLETKLNDLIDNKKLVKKVGNKDVQKNRR